MKIILIGRYKIVEDEEVEYNYVFSTDMVCYGDSYVFDSATGKFNIKNYSCEYLVFGSGSDDKILNKYSCWDNFGSSSSTCDSLAKWTSYSSPHGGMIIYNAVKIHSVDNS